MRFGTAFLLFINLLVLAVTLSAMLASLLMPARCGHTGIRG